MFSKVSQKLSKLKKPMSLSEGEKLVGLCRWVSVHSEARTREQCLQNV